SLLWRPLPVDGEIRLVPRFEPPAEHLGFAVTRHEVFRELVAEIGPALIIARRMTPAAIERRSAHRRSPGMLVRQGSRSCAQRLGHETQLDIRPDAARQVGVEYSIDDAPVVTRRAAGVLA